MASKPIKTVVRLQLEAGKATPAPPVGTVLGPHGINTGDFCKQFNDKTSERPGDIIPAEITIYEDRSFSFILKTPPASALLKKAAGISKGAANALTEKVGKVSQAQLREIAETKMEDLNAYDVDQAMKIVAGTAKNMGIEVEK
ncbi:MAG: 50S ribosomal protein L11 [Candidatus Harrisonbacteria bacterium]|nr:50S ribosomal protein L11 [Candidatus Harrisonbacteria bacterium]